MLHFKRTSIQKEIWFYDHKLKKCFASVRCASSNNFKTKEACETTCIEKQN